MKANKSLRDIFTPERRKEILDFLIDKFEEDKRIACVILVGSGAYDFIDDLSDIDLAVVTFPEYNLLQILKDWKEKIPQLLDIIECFEVQHTPRNLLLGFLTEDFLEINIGLQNTENISAKRKHWKIIFDKTGKLQQVMEESWKKAQDKSNVSYFEYLVSGTWHYIICAVIALTRENYWRAINEIENIKKDLLEIAALRFNLKVNYFIDSEYMSNELQRNLMDSFISKLDKKEIFKAIKNLTKLYYEEASKTAKYFGISEYDYLSERISDYIQIMEKRLFTINIT